MDQVAETFPTAGFEDRIDFWKQVFTQYGERDVVLHDRDRACLLYDVLSFERSPRGSVREWRSQKRQIDRKQQQIRSLLDDLRRHGAEGEKRSAQHQELADLLRRCDCSLSAASLRSLRNNIHAQRGIKEKFRDGIVRSGTILGENGKYLREARSSYRAGRSAPTSSRPSTTQCVPRPELSAYGNLCAVRVGTI